MMKQLESFVILQSQWYIWTWRASCEHWRHANSKEGHYDVSFPPKMRALNLDAMLNSRMYWNVWHNWIYPVVTPLIVTSVWGTGSKRYTIWCNKNTLNVTIKNTAHWQLLHKILSLAWTLAQRFFNPLLIFVRSTGNPQLSYIVCSWKHTQKPKCMKVK